MEKVEILGILNDWKKKHEQDFTIENLINSLEKDIRLENSKKEDRANLRNVNVNTYIKKLFNKDCRKDLIGYSSYEGKFVFTDSYRLYVLNTDYGYEQLQKELPIGTIIPKDCDVSVEIEVDLGDLKTFIDLNKQEKYLACYRLQKGDYNIWFNPKYLYEGLKLMGNNVIRCSLNNTRITKINGLRGEMCLLLPVRPPKNADDVYYLDKLNKRRK